MIIGICPAYLPSIKYIKWVINQKKLYFITNGNYQKQTFRNRAEIYGPNGKLKLIIPVNKNKKQGTPHPPPPKEWLAEAIPGRHTMPR